MERPAPLDQDMLRRVRARSPEALDAFFAYFFDRVYGYVLRLQGDRVLSEDLTQESFLKMHRAIDRLDPARDPTAWVFKVVTNTVRDHWRSRHHRGASMEVSLEETEEAKIVDGRTSPEVELEEREQTEAIQAALASLPWNDREVILLREYEGLTAPEIASLLGISKEAVRQRHSRAVTRLGEAYRKVRHEAQENP